MQIHRECKPRVKYTLPNFRLCRQIYYKILDSCNKILGSTFKFTSHTFLSGSKSKVLFYLVNLIIATVQLMWCLLQFMAQ